MHVILKWLVRIFGVLAVLAVVGLLAAWYLVSRSLPAYEGALALAGLDGPVTIIRDANAVPHIRAASDHDAFFALGLVHAQDRLWQMELSRRAAQGRLSELLGERTIGVDRLMKTLDLYGHASRSLEHQSTEAIGVLEAYAAGVNAWIRHVNEQALGRGAPEFFAFGAALAPWTPVDSLAIIKVMALRLSGGARNEVRRARTVLTLPADRVADILPEYPAPASVVPGRAAIDPGSDRARAGGWDVAHLRGSCSAPGNAPCAGSSGGDDPLALALGLAPPPHMAGASNAWAVDGSRTASGKPILANDPHLWLSVPSVWHLADIRGGAISAIGGALPGAPLIAVGHNGKLGWGLTTANVDDQDLFVERLNPENPEQYLLPDGSWANFSWRAIRIEVSGGTVVTETVRATRHGPVLTGDQFDADRITPEGHVTALGWTALTDDDRSLSALIALMYADRIETAVAAAADVVAPAQNLILADRDGVGSAWSWPAPFRCARRNPSLGGGCPRPARRLKTTGSAGYPLPRTPGRSGHPRVWWRTPTTARPTRLSPIT